MSQNPDTQRSFALSVVADLRAAGYQALWAGGCVRDDLLGAAPKDYDVATSARPEQVRDLFGRRRTVAVGASFGVITVLGPPGAGQIEVATFRRDGGYSDGRRPDSVEFSDPEQDALRRDFTVNGMFYDPIDSRVIDFVGGRQDLADRVVRAIGEPAARIEEDKLRMLRAVRFAAALAFEIDPGTKDAIVHRAPSIHLVSAERIGGELARMIVHPARARALRLLRECGLLVEVLPEWAVLGDTRQNATLERLDRLRDPSLMLAFAALMSPCGSQTATAAAERLKQPKRVGEGAGWLIAQAALAAQGPLAYWPDLQRVLIDPRAEDLVALLRAEAEAETAGVAFCRTKLRLPATDLNPSPLIDGQTLLSAGFSAGPGLAKALRAARDAQLLGQVQTVEEALAVAKRSH